MKGEEVAEASGDDAQEKGLKDYYEDYFPMGVAVSPNSDKGEEAKLIKAQYNSITPENVMKMGPIHPEKDRFNWEPADALANFARENDLMMRGHALVWHQQAGDWIFKTDNGGQVSKEELYARMKTHIDSVVTRYKDVIYAWDVVNEAIDDNASEFLRKSEWYEIAGDEFISKTFEYARAADPDVKLFYNDYNAIILEKESAVINRRSIRFFRFIERI